MVVEVEIMEVMEVEEVMLIHFWWWAHVGAKLKCRNGPYHRVAVMQISWISAMDL